MLEQRIQQQFFESADLIYQVAEHLARPVAEAAGLITTCLTSGGKLLVHAQGESQLAELFCQHLLQGFERDRPALAACPLALLSTSALAQLAALGQPGDLLVALCPQDEDPLTAELMARAHAKDMGVVMVSGGMGGHWPSLLRDTDVWVAIPHERRARVQELHLLVLHALCDAIDVQLLGDAEPA